MRALRGHYSMSHTGMQMKSPFRNYPEKLPRTENRPGQFFNRDPVFSI